MHTADFGLLFAMLLCCVMVITGQKQQELNAVQNVQQEYRWAMESAAEQAAFEMAEWQDGQEVMQNLEACSEQFFLTASLCLGQGTRSERIMWWQERVPLLLFVQMQGVAAAPYLSGTRQFLPFHPFAENLEGYQVEYALNDYVRVKKDGVLVAEGYYRDVQPFFSFAAWEDSFEEAKSSCITRVVTETFQEAWENALAERAAWAASPQIDLPALAPSLSAVPVDRISLLAFYWDAPFGTDMTGYYPRILSVGASWKK